MIRTTKSWNYWLPDPTTMNDNDTKRREDIVSKGHMGISDVFAEEPKVLAVLSKVSDAMYEIENIACDIHQTVNDNAIIADQMRDIALYALDYFKAFAVQADDNKINDMTLWCNEKLYKDWRWFKISSDMYAFIVHDEVEQIHFKLRWS